MSVPAGESWAPLIPVVWCEERVFDLFVLKRDHSLTIVSQLARWFSLLQDPRWHFSCWDHFTFFLSFLYGVFRKKKEYWVGVIISPELILSFTTYIVCSRAAGWATTQRRPGVTLLHPFIWEHKVKRLRWINEALTLRGAPDSQSHYHVSPAALMCDFRSVVRFWAEETRYILKCFTLDVLVQMLVFVISVN